VSAFVRGRVQHPGLASLPKITIFVPVNVLLFLAGISAVLEMAELGEVTCPSQPVTQDASAQSSPASKLCSRRTGPPPGTEIPFSGGQTKLTRCLFRSCCRLQWLQQAAFRHSFESIQPLSPVRSSPWLGPMERAPA